MPRYSVDAQVWFHVEADNEDEAMHKACEQARIMFADRLADVDGEGTAYGHPVAADRFFYVGVADAGVGK